MTDDDDNNKVDFVVHIQNLAVTCYLLALLGIIPLKLNNTSFQYTYTYARTHKHTLLDDDQRYQSHCSLWSLVSAGNDAYQNHHGLCCSVDDDDDDDVTVVVRVVVHGNQVRQEVESVGDDGSDHRRGGGGVRDARGAVASRTQTGIGSDLPTRYVRTGRIQIHGAGKVHANGGRGEHGRLSKESERLDGGTVPDAEDGLPSRLRYPPTGQTRIDVGMPGIVHQLHGAERILQVHLKERDENKKNKQTNERRTTHG